MKKKEDVVPADRMFAQYATCQIFTKEQENSFVEYISFRAKICYGMTSMETRKAVYQLAECNNVNVPQTWKDNNRAGEEWLCQLRQRYPRISLRKPEPCSLARATSFNKSNVDPFPKSSQNFHQILFKIYKSFFLSNYKLFKISLKVP